MVIHRVLTSVWLDNEPRSLMFPSILSSSIRSRKTTQFFMIQQVQHTLQLFKSTTNHLQMTQMACFYCTFLLHTVSHPQRAWGQLFLCARLFHCSDTEAGHKVSPLCAEKSLYSEFTSHLKYRSKRGRVHMVNQDIMRDVRSRLLIIL